MSTPNVDTPETSGTDTLITAAPETDTTATAIVEGDAPADETTTGETTDDGTTSEGDDAVEAGAPDEYVDFDMPEGVTLDADLLGKASPIFKELGLNQEQAQKLVNLQAEQIQANSAASVESFEAQKEDWLNQTKNDSEIGGDKFETTVKNAQLAIDKLGSPGLKEILDGYGVGNNPDMVRFVARVGELLREDSPNSVAPVSPAPPSTVDILYPPT